MPSGRTHLAINAAFSAALLGTLAAAGTDLISPTGAGLGAGLLIGSVWITPDLDMRGVRTAPLRAWGPLGCLWGPLLAVLKHRGVSHTFVRGPLLRVAYLALIGALLTGALHAALPSLSVPPLPEWSGPAAQAAAAGYVAAQWTHLIADRIKLTFRNL